MRKAVASVTIGLVLALGIPGSAWAKGPESVTISGRGLDESIEVPLAGPGSQGSSAPPPYLVVALTTLADPFAVMSAGAVDVRTGSPGDLGDHYTLTWHMAHPPRAGNTVNWTVVQDVYPHLGTGPLIHTHPSPYLGGRSGWYRAPDALRSTLAALVAPVAGLSPTTVARSAESSGVPTWTLPAAAVAGLALGTGGGRAARRAQRLAARRPARRPKKVPSPSEMPLA